MSSGAFSRRALRIGAMCSREAIIALKSSKKSPLKASGRRKIAMLPTCIGISGVSRYRNDASIEDSFLASLIVPSRHTHAGAFGGASGVQTVLELRTWSGLCIFRGRICNGKRPRSIKLAEFALGLGQPVRDRPQGGGVDPQAHVTGKVNLDVFSGFGRTQDAGPPVHNAVGARVDRGGRNRQIA